MCVLLYLTSTYGRIAIWIDNQPYATSHVSTHMGRVLTPVLEIGRQWEGVKGGVAQKFG